MPHGGISDNVVLHHHSKRRLLKDAPQSDKMIGTHRLWFSALSLPMARVQTEGVGRQCDHIPLQSPDLQISGAFPWVYTANVLVWGKP